MSWLTDVGRAIAGAVPGGAQVYDSLSTKEGRSSAVQEAMDRLNAQAQGVVAGATAGGGAVVAAQNARAANVGVPAMLITLAIGAGLVLIISGRR